MPGDPGATVVTNACVLLPYTRDCGCNGHPAFPTPFFCWAKVLSTTRALAAARTRRCILTSLRAQRSNPSGNKEARVDCFASLAMTTSFLSAHAGDPVFREADIEID